MKYLTLIAGLSLAACAAEPPLARPGSAPVNFPAEVLRIHNAERAAARVGPLAWDAQLAGSAAIYARELARAGTLRHSPHQARPRQGENLWMGTRGAFAISEMVVSWASERRFFRAGIFPAVSSTGNWADVGHYSQMIWPTSTSVGCAIASNARADFLVCRYAPAGNIDGRRIP